MARRVNKESWKTETLTIRLDPSTRFALDFVAKLNGQTVTTVVERAILEAAEKVRIAHPTTSGLSWRSFWSANEGARALRMAAAPELFPSAEEQIKLAFAREHEPFFFDGPSLFNKPNLEVIWPRIGEFVELWEQTKSTDYFAAGRAMAEALASAGLTPPQWPPHNGGTVASQ